MKNDDLSHSPRAALQDMLNYLREAAALNEIPQPGITEETALPPSLPDRSFKSNIRNSILPRSKKALLPSIWRLSFIRSPTIRKRP